MNLRIKFILFFSGVIVLMIAGLTFYLNAYLKNYFKARTIDNFQLLAETSEGSYFSFIESLKTRTIDWSSDGYIRNAVEEILSGKKESVKNLNFYLKEKKIIYDPEVVIIDILNKDGIVISSSLADRIGEDESDENIRFHEAIAAGFGEALVAPVVYEEYESSEPMIHISARIFSTKESADKKFVPLDAVMLLHFVNTDRLSALLSGKWQKEKGALTGAAFFDEYQTAEIYLVNKDRLMITQSRFIEYNILKHKVDTEPVSACFENNLEMAGEYLNYDGKKVLGASMCIEKDEIVLIVEAQSAEILSLLKKIQERIIFGGIFILILTIAGIALLSNWLLKGLTSIAEIAKKISENNFSARTNIKSKDEIGSLGEIFNEMLNNIEKNQKELKEKDVKIEEKLAELEKFKNLTIGRELKMIELKKELEELKKNL
ncbi:MAG: HAMP domain-containing protein [Patescibacteria group bacterium]